MRKAVKVLAGLRGRILNRWPDWGPEAEPSLQPPPSLWGTVRRANGGRRRAAGPEKLLARMGSFASTSTGGGMEEDVDREEKLKVAKDEVTTGAAPSEMSSPDTPLDFAAAGGPDADASSSGESGGDKGCARADGDRTGQSMADKVELPEGKKTRISDRDNNRDEKGCLLFDLNEDAPLDEN